MSSCINKSSGCHFGCEEFFLFLREHKGCKEDDPCVLAPGVGDGHLQCHDYKDKQEVLRDWHVGVFQDEKRRYDQFGSGFDIEHRMPHGNSE